MEGSESTKEISEYSSEDILGKFNKTIIIKKYIYIYKKIKNSLMKFK